MQVVSNSGFCLKSHGCSGCNCGNINTFTSPRVSTNQPINQCIHALCVCAGKCATCLHPFERIIQLFLKRGGSAGEEGLEGGGEQAFVLLQQQRVLRGVNEPAGHREGSTEREERVGIRRGNEGQDGEKMKLWFCDTKKKRGSSSRRKKRQAGKVDNDEKEKQVGRQRKGWTRRRGHRRKQKKRMRGIKRQRFFGERSEGGQKKRRTARSRGTKGKR